MRTLWLGSSHQQRLELPADSLVTHGVCLGMTGSGKTGLCISLLEELAGAGVPVVAIDPKGDLCNLALDEAPPEGRAAWKEGQKAWGISDAEIAGWRRKVEVRIYTPGSDAARSVNVLAALRRPEGVEEDEVRRERVTGTVSALLGLAGEEADPVRSPSHVVLSKILGDAWDKGEDPDLESLVAALLDPPFAKVGVFPTDKFFPPDDRMDLARKLNAVMVSPTFAAWSRGEPLEIPSLFASSADGRTPLHIFTLSHLSEAERNFFVGLLLERIALWTRSLPGSPTLRGLLFFDEIWGYLPPHPKNPPSKRPLLTLLKQARAVGIGTVLATQNPVDIDYKALSNTGTWFIGRLQTRNDRDRVSEGLGAAGLDRSAVDSLLDGVQPRRFLLYQTGRPPTFLDTRWTRVYLAGPLTRLQLRALSGNKSLSVTSQIAIPRSVVSPPAASSAGTPSVPRRKINLPQWLLDPRVVFSARFEGAFTPESGPPRYRPGLLVELNLRFDEEKAGFVEDRRQFRLYYPLEDDLPLAPLYLPLEPSDLLTALPDCTDPLPDWVDEPSELKSLIERVVDEVLAQESTGFWTNPGLKLNGRSGETEEQFRARCDEAAERQMEGAAARQHDKIRREVDAIEAKIRTLEQKRERQESERSSKQTAELINAGETMLAWFTGRRKSLSQLASHRQKVSEAGRKVEEVDEELTELRRELFELETGLEAAVEKAGTERRLLLTQTRQLEVHLEREDIRVLRGGILWIPVTRRL